MGAVEHFSVLTLHIGTFTSMEGSFQIYMFNTFKAEHLRTGHKIGTSISNFRCINFPLQFDQIEMK